MLLLLTLLLIDPFDPLLKPAHVVVDERGFFIQNESKVFHFNSQGELLFQIDKKPKETGELWLVGDHYLFQSKTGLYLTVYNSKGEVVKVIDNAYWRFVHPQSDNTMVIGNVGITGADKKWHSEKNAKTIGYNKFLSKMDVFEKSPTVLELGYLDSRNGEIDIKLGKRFFRVTERQRLLNFNNKKVFVEKENDTFFIMTELDEAIYVYDSETVEQERKTDNQADFSKPSISLNLVNFQPVSNEIAASMKSFYYSWEDYSADLTQVLNGFSKVVFFKKGSNGFSVGYTVPKPTVTKRQEGVPYFPRLDLYFQDFDKEGRALGSPVIVEDLAGEFAGIIGDKLYWLTKEDANIAEGDLDVFDLFPAP